MATTERFVDYYCREHGPVYRHRGAGRGSMIVASEIEALRADVALPRSGERVLCPFCGKDFYFVFDAPLDPPRDEDPSEGDWESEGGATPDPEDE